MPNRQVASKHSPFASSVFDDVDITVAVEDSNEVDITLQFRSSGKDLAQRACVSAYLSDDANGDSIAGTAPDTVAIGTDGVLIQKITGKAFDIICEADGDADLTITEDGADTWYLVIVLPDGSLKVSDAITFTAP